MTRGSKHRTPGTPAASATPQAGPAEPARGAPLAMPPEQFRVLGHRLVDLVTERLAAIPSGPVARGESPSDVRRALGLGGPLPEHGADPRALLDEAARGLFEHSTFNGHPRFFGYITAPPAPIGILGDFLASAVNANCGAWSLSPAAAEIESEVVRWTAELIGFPADCGGLLVSGGNMANLVCFYAARTAQAGWDLRAGGFEAADARRLRVYGSAETHTWIQKACDLGGLGTDAMRWVPTDDGLRMDVGELARRIAADRAAGLKPMMVIGTAGSVSTGAIDALPEIAALCRREGLWFHVDGAYGGFAAALADAPPDLKALALADSVAVDPHKWLYAPLEAGCALVRDRDQLRNAFSYTPPYYHLEERGINYVEYGPQNSRGFRALKVWLALRQVGAAGYRAMIADDIRLAERMDAAVRRQAELEPYTQSLSITTFRYVPADLRERVGEEAVEGHLDALNRELLDRLQKGGEVFVSNAVIRGRYVLRSCIVNFHSDVADVEAVPEVAVRVGQAIDRQLRPAGLR
jgi:aromatic-L-amino-acid decarboxylase